MKKCPVCNIEYYDEDKFCEQCGEKLVETISLKCTHCGAELKHETKFCPKCGVSVEEVSLDGQVLGEGFQIGENGPAGGWIFYDKGSYSDGWRYLEAAPSDIYLKGIYNLFVFGYYRKEADGRNLFVNGTEKYNPKNCTRSEIGTGKSNTEMLVAAMGNSAYMEDTGTKTTVAYAAKLCADYKLKAADGKIYDDWFLPSSEELNQMYFNLMLKGIGRFGSSESEFEYWSSSESDVEKCYAFHSRIYARYHYLRSSFNKVRPVRAF